MNFYDFEDWHDRWNEDWNDRWNCRMNDRMNDRMEARWAARDARRDRFRRRHRHGFNMVPILFVIGGWLVLRHMFLGGMVLFAIAVAKTIGWLGPRTASAPRAMGSQRAPESPRVPNASEQVELDAIFAYATALDKAGSGGALSKELRERAEKMVRTSGDATLALREMRAQLPPLKAAERDSFDARLKREVDLINATERELNSIQPQV